MKLAWIKYAPPGTKPKYMLVLTLGTKDDKFYCLDANMPEKAREFFKSKSTYLSGLTLEERIQIIRDQRPEAMAGYKTIHASNVTIEREYEVNASSSRPAKSGSS